jgi:hypothetical protein
MPTGPVFLLAFAEDWSAVTKGEGDTIAFVPGPSSFVHHPSSPAAGWLALILREDATVDFWDERWEKLTGIAHGEMVAAPGELVLDLLFPGQQDRNFVADLLRRSEALHSRRAVQAILEVAGPGGSQPLSCTLLPLGTRAQGHWLLLVSEPDLAAREGTGPQHFVQRVTEGLSVMLARHLAVSLHVPEGAEPSRAFPLDLASWFTQVLEAALTATHLFAQWQNMSATGEPHPLSPAKVLVEIVDEQAGYLPSRCELTVEPTAAELMVGLPAGVLDRLLRLLLNLREKQPASAQAAPAAPSQVRREVRVFAQGQRVCCGVRDRGETLTPLDWPAVLALLMPSGELPGSPIGHALLDASGLTLTVGRSLPSQPEVWLGLRTAAAEGTTLLLVLPRSEVVNPTNPEAIRTDAPTSPTGPHAPSAATAAEGGAPV